jgi:hypothetical protein
VPVHNTHEPFAEHIDLVPRRFSWYPAPLSQLQIEAPIGGSQMTISPSGKEASISCRASGMNATLNTSPVRLTQISCSSSVPKHPLLSHEKQLQPREGIFSTSPSALRALGQ